MSIKNYTLGVDETVSFFLSKIDRERIEIGHFNTLPAAYSIAIAMDVFRTLDFEKGCCIKFIGEGDPIPVTPQGKGDPTLVTPQGEEMSLFRKKTNAVVISAKDSKKGSHFISITKKEIKFRTVGMMTGEMDTVYTDHKKLPLHKDEYNFVEDGIPVYVIKRYNGNMMGEFLFNPAKKLAPHATAGRGFVPWSKVIEAVNQYIGSVVMPEGKTPIITEMDADTKGCKDFNYGQYINTNSNITVKFQIRQIGKRDVDIFSVIYGNNNREEIARQRTKAKTISTKCIHQIFTKKQVNKY